MTSRVVPASAETIAASRRASALSRLDLPAFGGPSSATRKPSRRISPRCPSSRCAAISVREHRGPLSCFGEATTPTHRLRRRNRLPLRSAPRSRSAASASRRRASKARRRLVPVPGGAGLLFRHRSRSARPSTWARSSLPFSKARRTNSPGSARRHPAISPSAARIAAIDRATAVDLELDDILACLARWRFEPNHHGTIERFAGRRMPDQSGMPHSAASAGPVTIWSRASASCGARHANDGDAGASGCAREREDS